GGRLARRSRHHQWMQGLVHSGETKPVHTHPLLGVIPAKAGIKYSLASPGYWVARFRACGEMMAFILKACETFRPHPEERAVARASRRVAPAHESNRRRPRTAGVGGAPTYSHAAASYRHRVTRRK